MAEVKYRKVVLFSRTDLCFKAPAFTLFGIKTRRSMVSVWTLKPILNYSLACVAGN